MGRQERPPGAGDVWVGYRPIKEGMGTRHSSEKEQEIRPKDWKSCHCPASGRGRRSKKRKERSPSEVPSIPRDLGMPNSVLSNPHTDVQGVPPAQVRAQKASYNWPTRSEMDYPTEGPSWGMFWVLKGKAEHEKENRDLKLRKGC